VARYDAQFFNYIVEGSIASARVIVPLLKQWLSVDSVLDVGCGQGAWLKVWRENGVEQAFGMDGAYVDRQSLLFPDKYFHAVDLDRPFALDRRFSLVTCLEVAEHLPAEQADNLVRCLCNHGDYLLFSAAVPGQGGANHINEQHYGYWQTRIEANGFRTLDCVRPLIINDERVKPWYRYNTILYVREDRHDELPDPIKATMLAPGLEPPDVSPLWYKLRKLVLRQLPVSVINRMAVLNERWTRL